MLPTAAFDAALFPAVIKPVVCHKAAGMKTQFLFRGLCEFNLIRSDVVVTHKVVKV